MGAAEEATDHEPDYRFTLANERTYLAWIRTSLALLVGGAAVTQLLPSLGPTPLRYLLVLGLVGLAFVLAASSYHRWMRVDRAIRRGGPCRAAGCRWRWRSLSALPSFSRSH